MTTKKTLYVPRNWKVSYSDASGNEHKDVTIRANAEYRITESNGKESIVTISGIHTENDKTLLVAKVLLKAGTMFTMTKLKHIGINLANVVDITPVVTTYAKAPRGKRVPGDDIPVFTFAFDTERYPTQYKVTVQAGEFVALAIKDPKDPNKGRRSIYGHITSVNEDSNSIEFSRYISKKGVRDVYEMTVELDQLLGIYRYELQIDSIAKAEHNVASEVESVKTEEE